MELSLLHRAWSLIPASCNMAHATNMAWGRAKQKETTSQQIRVNLWNVYCWWLKFIHPAKRCGKLGRARFFWKGPKIMINDDFLADIFRMHPNWRIFLNENLKMSAGNFRRSTGAQFWCIPMPWLCWARSWRVMWGIGFAHVNDFSGWLVTF